MYWLVLSVAVFVEIVWALSLKWAQMQGSWLYAAVPIALSFVNMGLLSLAMRGIPAGTAYAIWTGLGAIGVIIGGTLFFHERVNVTQVAFMLLTIIGVGGTKLFAQS